MTMSSLDESGAGMRLEAAAGPGILGRVHQSFTVVEITDPQVSSSCVFGL